MARALVYCTIAYLLALLAAYAVGWYAAELGVQPLWVALSGDVAATLVVFGFSVALNNSSMYDPYWSVAPLPLGVYFAEQHSPRAVLVLLLLTVWGARLTYNFLRGWQGLAHEDWRYVSIRQKTGRAYWLVSLLGIHLFPTLMVFAGCLPLYAALASDARPLQPLDAVAFVVTALAIAIEAIADAQLRRFKLRSDRRADDVLVDGLWARARHPNYFGEMLFWWGLWLFALAVGPQHAWTGVGALAITLMFHLVSLRLLEARMQERRPEYARRVSSLPAFVPYGRMPKQAAS